MDGRKPLLRRLLIASLALTGATVDLPAEEPIRQPLRAQLVSKQSTVPAKPISLDPPPISKPPGVPSSAVQSLQPPRLPAGLPKRQAVELQWSPTPTVKRQEAEPLSISPLPDQVKEVELPPKPAATPQSQPLEVQPKSAPSAQRMEVEPSSKPAPARASQDVELRANSAPGPIAQSQVVVKPAATREELAARISEELQAKPSADSTSAAPGSLEPGPGWQAVGEELKEHVGKCEALLSRHAYLSAREEANRAILRLARVLDLRQNKFTCEPAWARAQQALREADDFTTLQRIANDSDLFTRLIQSHETPVLRDASVADLTPLAAAQHYRAYAETCLIEASQGHPWFSELYYCVGRSLQAQSGAGNVAADAMLQQALTYYRSAYAIQPSNATNANQVGFVLLRMDRPQEALTQLSQVVRLPNCPLEGWQNLAQASSRLGDNRTAQWAAQNYTALRASGQEPSVPTGTLVEVDPRQFAAMSPYSSGPQATAAPAQAPVAPSTAHAPTQTSAGRTAAAAGTGFFR